MATEIKEVKGIKFHVETIDRPSGNQIMKAERIDNRETTYYLIIQGRAVDCFDSLVDAHKADQERKS